jgi:hypothetical protein
MCSLKNSMVINPFIFILPGGMPNHAGMTIPHTYVDHGTQQELSIAKQQPTHQRFCLESINEDIFYGNMTWFLTQR